MYFDLLNDLDDITLDEWSFASDSEKIDRMIKAITSAITVSLSVGMSCLWNDSFIATFPLAILICTSLYLDPLPNSVVNVRISDFLGEFDNYPATGFFNYVLNGAVNNDNQNNQQDLDNSGPTNQVLSYKP